MSAYLLPLRHPVTVARQLATIAARAGSAHARRRARRRGPPRDRNLRGRPEDAWTPNGRMPSHTATPGRRHAGHLRRRVLCTQRRPDSAGAVAVDTSHRGRTIGCGGQPRRDAWRRLARDLGLPTPIRRGAPRSPPGGGRRQEPGRFEHALNVWCGFERPEERHVGLWPWRCSPSTRCPSSRSSATRPAARPRM